MRLSKVFYTIATLIIYLILILYFLHPISVDYNNSDLGRHLTLGKIIVSLGRVPKANLLSYSYPDFNFINSHWLSEVIYYVIYSSSGFNGLIILSTLSIITAFSFVFIPAAKKINYITSIYVSLISLQVLYGRTEIRPELFSFLFLSIFIFILYKYREKYTNWIFVLIPLELLWVNLHIYFFVGIAVLFIFLLDLLIAKRQTFASKQVQILLLASFFCGIATVFNPNNFKGALFPLVVFNNYGISVEENVSYFKALSNPAYNSSLVLIYFGLSVAILWLSIIIARRKMRLIDIFLSAFFTFVGLFAVRDIPLFVFGTFISLVTAVSETTNIFLKRIRIIDKNILLYSKTIFFVLVIIILLPTITSNIEIQGLGFGVRDNTKNAMNFFLKSKIKGPIFNNFDVGNYLDFRLYPQEKVFVDNRPEAYPKDFFQNIYFPMQESPTIFKNVDNKYHFNSIFIEYPNTSSKTTIFIQNLVKDNNWKMVYLDSSIVIFLKNNSSNKSTINRYLINQENFKIQNVDLVDRNKTGQLANFFKAVGWQKPRADMIIQYLKFDPKNCSALGSAVYLLQKLNDPKATSYMEEYQQNCSY